MNGLPDAALRTVPALLVMGKFGKVRQTIAAMRIGHDRHDWQ